MTPNLKFIFDAGGTTRRHKYLRDIRTFIGFTLIAIVLQAIIYALTLLRVGRTDWLGPSLILAFVPSVSALVLTAFRRHQFPLTSAVIVVLGVSSLAVSFISALRIPVSYFGVMLCVIPTVVAMVIANIRFHSALSDQVAVLDFPGARTVSTLLDVPVVDKVVDVDQILIDPRHTHEPELLNTYYMRGVEIMPWPRFMEIRLGRVDIGSFDISHIRLTPSQVLYSRAKRLFDIGFVVLTAPLTLVLSVLVATYIFVRDGRPVFFVQERVGYGGARFRIYKFRTMTKGADAHSALPRDKRILPGASLVRRFRLDELPQLFNVLRGEMSLIGPRPVTAMVAQSCELAQPKFVQRYLVKPGLTGWAQVHSGYAGTTEEELLKLSYDLYYVRYQSFDVDSIILFRTMKTLLLGSGAR